MCQPDTEWMTHGNQIFNVLHFCLILYLGQVYFPNSAGPEMLYVFNKIFFVEKNVTDLEAAK